MVVMIIITQRGEINSKKHDRKEVEILSIILFIWVEDPFKDIVGS